MCSYNHKALFRKIQERVSQQPLASLSGVANYLGAERHTLERVIRSQTGMCFRTWRSQLILERAQTLLQDPANLSIKEIAFTLGYQSPQAFARFFRISAKCSPTTFRSRYPFRAAV